MQNKQARQTCNAYKKEALWTPTFIVVVGVTLFSFLVGQGLNAGTSVYLSHIGESATLAGVGAALFSFAGVFVRLLCGKVIDSHGRAIVIVAGTITLAIGTLGPAFSNQGLPFVFWRILQGAGFAAATTAAATAAADVLPLSRLGEGIGYYGLGQAIAMSVGPAFALFLVSTKPAENLYLGLFFVSILAFVFALLCRYEKHPEKLPSSSNYRTRLKKLNAGTEKTASSAALALKTKEAEGGGVKKESEKSETNETRGANESRGAKAESGASKSKNKKLKSFLHDLFEPKAIPGTIPMLIISPTFGFGIFFVGLYGVNLGIENSGLFYTISAIFMIIIRLRSSVFMDRIAPFKIFSIAVVAGVISFLLLLISGIAYEQGGSSTNACFYVAGAFYGVCIGIAIPINQTVSVKNSPIERWGAANALFLLANDIGIGVSSILWGSINDNFGFSASICGVICCILLSWLAAHHFYPSLKRSQVKHSASQSMATE